ncbi:MAG: hypothetical protein JO002_13960 [Burkholderiaceae bacterium]|nr:hypothetical protein [Burkholderiaceae bacterium]
MKRVLAILLMATAAILNSGCAVNRATATADPSLKWDGVKSVHVVKAPEEDGSIQKLIVEKFRSKGFTVTMDPEADPGADARVTYKDRWMWDITMYLLELTVVVRDPKSDFPLATGNSLHTSLTRKSPQEMVDEVVNNILTAKK